ncbi:ATP-binding protein [Vibrio sp.]|nr:ATP-binding protein [Vibrio sp.]
MAEQPTIAQLERQIKRERARRKAAEQLLENKSLELYQSNKQLQAANNALENKNELDLRRIEFNEQIDHTLIMFGNRFLSKTVTLELIGSFFNQLTDCLVVQKAALSLNPDTLPFLGFHYVGDDSLYSKPTNILDIHWKESTLHLPLQIQGGYVGELIILITPGDLNTDFILKPMSVVRDLLTSALHRQCIEQEFVEARKRAEHSEKATREFVAMINHEMRTPLNGLLGNAELLKETELQQEQTDLLSNLVHSGDLLKVIINDLLDFSKLNANMLELMEAEFSWLDIESTLKGIFNSKAASMQLSFSVQHDPSLPLSWEGDTERIKQILINLVGNAIKFTPAGSVSVYSCLDNGALKVEVEDSGVGIPPSYKETLFDPFTQVDRSSKRKHEGTGLGLAICHSLVTMMGGSIDYDSEEGKGTCFTLILPLKHSSTLVQPKEESQKAPNEYPDYSGLSVLVVDDITMNQMVLTQMLKKMQITPEVASNGIEALEQADKKKYDIIFMDCRMPEMDGFEATRQLRGRQFTNPIIAVTAGTSSEERQQCLQSGMNSILTKPYTPKEILDTISEHYL